MSHEVDVIGLGENSVDRVLVVPQLPGSTGAPSKMPLLNVRRNCGGQVATAMVTCASLGLRAAYVGSIGDDEDGALVRSTLSAHHLNLTNLRMVTGAATRSATILVDAEGERAVLWHRDEKLNLSDAFVDAIDLTGVRLVHLDDTDIEAAIRLAARARHAGISVTTDIDGGVRLTGNGQRLTGDGQRLTGDGQRLTGDRERLTVNGGRLTVGSAKVLELLRLATHPILSEEALASLSGEADPEQGLRALRDECEGVLCVTLGARGAMALERDRLVFAPGVPVTPVDTTGAGDAFRGGLIYALLDGRPVEAAMRFANQVAAESCMREGAISSVRR